MPELPDITLYLEALQHRVLGQTLRHVRIFSPFLLRTATPGVETLHGRQVLGLRRLGKRIAVGFEDELWLVVHLMIAGRLHWRPVSLNSRGAVHVRAVPPRSRQTGGAQAGFEFESGTLTLTEAGTKRRASVHLVQGEASLEQLNPGGLEVLGSQVEQFAEALASENHTLKRALTDPRLFSGIGNAYADEILHRARLSPAALTQKLAPGQIAQLHRATTETLTEWIQRLRRKTGGDFPENVTAFQPEMAVHGKFGRACPVCGTKVQRIRYAENETNYCPACQTGGKLLADRALSLLLKDDWPRTVAELEEIRAGKAAGQRAA